MKQLILKYWRQTVVLTALLFLYLTPVAVSQEVSTELSIENSSVKKPILIDEFGRLPECDFSGRLDNFFYELSKKPDHLGYIINYLGIDVLPGDRYNPFQERRILNQITFRGFDGSRITLLQGGYRASTETTLWLVPPGGELPEPTDTVLAPSLPKNQSFLFAKRGIAFFEDLEFREDFLLESVREKQRQEDAIREAEYEAEQAAQRIENGEVLSEDDETLEEPQQEELSEEERFDLLFGWADVGIGELLKKQKNDNGLIIFYANDEYFDISKINALIQQARNLITNNAGIKSSRIKVQFGGYRSYPEVEFWVVSAKGKKPVPTPEERVVEEDDLSIEIHN